MKTTDPTTTLSAAHDCVELGVWTAIPAIPPSSLVLKLKDVDADASHAIKSAGVMSFHAVGCSGCRDSQEATTKVAQTMAVQVGHPHRLGGATTALPASFLYHLGDVVYKKDKVNEEELSADDDDNAPGAESATGRTDFGAFYKSQFFDPFANYAPPIFALAGNHDGKDKFKVTPGDKPRKSAIRHFLKYFCGVANDKIADNSFAHRPPVKQPYPYWLLETPLAYFIGLYSNVCNAGQLDDPAGVAQPQFDWLVQTLSSIKAAADGRAVFLTVHYPPYSAAVNFHERGDPNLGPSAPADQSAEPIGMLLQKAFKLSGQFPDAVLSAHAHLYQRLTYTCADGRQIPYLIAGAGGHIPVEKLAKPCAKSDSDPGPFGDSRDIVLPKKLTIPAGDKVKLAAFNERDFGFLRLTLDGNKQTLTGEYFTAFFLPPSTGSLPALDDSFVLDLRSHRIL